jgi:hypothetical protein
MRRVPIKPVPLLDVRDVVGVCKTTLNRALATTGQTLSDEQYEDALGHLLAEAVSMAANEYDPTKGISFSNYLTRYLPGRLVDWNRSEFGDSRNKTRRPELVPFDTKTVDGDTSPTPLPAALTDSDDFVDQIIEAASFTQDVANLTTGARWILEHVALPIAHGESHEAVADTLNLSRRKVARLLEDLRNELLGDALGLDYTPTTDELLEELHALDTSPIDHDTKGAA